LITPERASAVPAAIISEQASRPLKIIVLCSMFKSFQKSGPDGHQGMWGAPIRLRSFCQLGATG
jgi:hypothetical protein